MATANAAAGYPIETLFSLFEEEAAASGTQSDNGRQLARRHGK